MWVSGNKGRARRRGVLYPLQLYSYRVIAAQAKPRRPRYLLF